MSIAIVTRVTASREHFGTFAYDRVAEPWPMGRYVPLCGQERNHDERWSIVEAPGFTDRDARRKPLCSRCLRALEDLRQLTLVRCRVCGCTDENACWPGCHWVEPDLCSSCVPEPSA